jgi:NAD(P)-dependent dehydrogenase (short-subunit alcohol dehydrogenase family)
MPVDDFKFDFNEVGLAGKTILLAGGSGGLGAAVSLLLARDGASLVIGYRTRRKRAVQLKEAIERRYGRDVKLVSGDIGQSHVRARWIREATAVGDGLYAAVCLCGDPARVKFSEVTEADLRHSWDVNYIAPILLAREAAGEMKGKGISGAVVLFSTMQAIVPFDSSINYAGPKSALILAARVLAKEWGGSGGIRVNVLAPGVNKAGMALQSIASGKYDFFLQKDIIPRFGRPEDVAKVVRLLVEPDSYLTGQVITVDGGLTLRRDRLNASSTAQ